MFTQILCVFVICGEHYVKPLWEYDTESHNNAQNWKFTTVYDQFSTKFFVCNVVKQNELEVGNNIITGFWNIMSI